MSPEKVSIRVVAALTVFIASCGGSAMKSGPAHAPRDMDPTTQMSQIDTTRAREQMPERIYEKEGWKLVVYVTNKGTRSQGIHGDLFHNGTPVSGKRGQTLTTPLGDVYYHGSEMERANLWDTTGWTISGKSGFFNLSTPPSDSGDDDQASRPLEYGIG